jgi:hypothetical protein
MSVAQGGHSREDRKVVGDGCSREEKATLARIGARLDSINAKLDVLVKAAQS